MSKDKTEYDSDDSLSEDSLEVSENVTNVTNVTSDTALDSPEPKISCALCVTRSKGNKAAWIATFPPVVAVYCLPTFPRHSLSMIIFRLTINLAPAII